MGVLLAAVLVPLVAKGAQWVRSLVAGVPSGALIVSGLGPGGAWEGSVESYDETSGAIVSRAALPDRSLCEARALAAGDGTIHLVGGGGPPSCADGGTTTNRVRIFHPDEGSWTTPACQSPCISLPG